MVGTLIKSYKHYSLWDDDKKCIANTINPNGFDYQLSMKNCQAIERGYDIEELADENYPNELWSDEESLVRKLAFTKGFQKALELLGDKKFGEQDMLKAIIMASSIPDPIDGKIWEKRTPAEIVNSLQPTEWDVIFNPDELDANGCLILIRI